jgi:DNA replication protein DnaC
MALAAGQFVFEFNSQNSPRWLSFLGKSGTGKTFLSDAIFQHAKKNHRLMHHLDLCCGVSMFFWPRLLSKLRDGEYWKVADIADSNFLFLDEIAIEHDASGFARDKLCEILSCRVGKWTVLTSNLTLQQLEAIDGRIASRMVRDRNIVIPVETVDYAARTH